MAAGLPVVAIDATGTRDIIKNQVNGLLTDDTSHALAAGIGELISKLPLKKQLIENSAYTLDQYDIRNQAGRLLSVYEQAINDKRTGKTVQVDSLSRT
jgi:glycosyltransferase involved in cell wall biosynthesis